MIWKSFKRQHYITAGQRAQAQRAQAEMILKESCCSRRGLTLRALVSAKHSSHDASLELSRAACKWHRKVCLPVVPKHHQIPAHRKLLAGASSGLLIQERLWHGMPTTCSTPVTTGWTVSRLFLADDDGACLRACTTKKNVNVTFSSVEHYRFHGQQNHFILLYCFRARRF
jgi:hypothetical protein